MTDVRVKFGEDEVIPEPVTESGDAVEAQPTTEALVPSKPATKSRSKAAAKPAAVDEPAVVVAIPPMRPSQVRAEAIAATGDPKVDVHRWAKSQGYPVPRTLYRVTPRHEKHIAAYPPAEVEAVDPSEATNRFVALRQIPLDKVHGITFSHVVLEG